MQERLIEVSSRPLRKIQYLSLFLVNNVRLNNLTYNCTIRRGGCDHPYPCFRLTAWNNYGEPPP